MTARATLVLLAVLALGGSLSACTGGSDQPSAAPTTTSASPTAPPATATEPPAPRTRTCYRLTYDEAVAPTTTAKPVGCTGAHTAVTFAVDTVDAVVDGHLLAVDSDRVQSQVATACPARFGSFVGGTVEARRLSMLRPVWFTPTLEQSDAGARWFRCDVVALATDGELAPLTGRLQGVLATTAGQDRYGMCGTAAPGTSGFERVICSRPHSWRAIAVVPLAPGPYPGAAKVRAAGQTPCQDAGAAAAADSLDYQWGYEWPTAQQWRDGQTFGRCWAPD